MEAVIQFIEENWEAFIETVESLGYENAEEAAEEIFKKLQKLAGFA